MEWLQSIEIGEFEIAIIATFIAWMLAINKRKFIAQTILFIMFFSSMYVKLECESLRTMHPVMYLFAGGYLVMSVKMVFGK